MGFKTQCENFHLVSLFTEVKSQLCLVFSVLRPSELHFQKTLSSVGMEIIIHLWSTKMDVQLNLVNIFSDNSADFSPILSLFLEIIGAPFFESSGSPKKENQGPSKLILLLRQNLDFFQVCCQYCLVHLFFRFQSFIAFLSSHIFFILMNWCLQKCSLPPFQQSFRREQKLT